MCIQTRLKMDHSGKSQKWINATGIRIRALHEWKDNTRGGTLCTDHDLPETQLELHDVICYKLVEWPISYRLFEILPLHNRGKRYMVCSREIKESERDGLLLNVKVRMK